MPEPLKTGEFIGQDGRKWSVDYLALSMRKSDGDAIFRYFETQDLGDPDFPAALAALNALYEESQRVIIPLTEQYRVVRDKDGERVEHRWGIQDAWVGFHGQPIDAIIAALHYREGE